MAQKQPYSFRWAEKERGKSPRIQILDADGSMQGEFTLNELISFVGMWGSSDRGLEWVPLWVNKLTGALRVEDLPVTASIVYTRNADNFITQEVWALAGSTVTVTYTRNADNFITARVVVVS